MLLPFRPLPHPDESLPGYSIRLTSTYGFRSPDSFARQVFGYSLPSTLSDKSISIDRWLASLEASIGSSPGKLGDHFAQLREQHRCEDPRRIIRDIVVSSPRVCEHCISEKHYHCFEWQVGHHIVCNSHHSAILDYCPECDSTLKWDENLLHGCGTCGYQWGTRSKALGNEDLSNYSLAQQITPDLAGLYQAYLHSAFIEGHSIWPRARLPYHPHKHFRMMQSAYRMVCDRWWNRRVAERFTPTDHTNPFRRSLVRVRSLRLEKLLNPIASSRLSFEEIESTVVSDPSLVIPKKHQRHLDTVVAEDISEADTVAEVLGISIHQVNQLVSRGILHCQSTTQILRDRVFDLSRVGQDISDLLTKAHTTSIDDVTDLDLEDAEGVAQRFGFDLVDCIDWLHSESLRFALVENPACLAGIRVRRKDLINCCESKLSKRADDEQLDRLTVMKMLGVPEAVLDFLGKEGVLPSERWYGPGIRYELKTVKGLLNRYRIARRESAIWGIPVSDAWKQLNRPGTNILLKELPGGHFVGIVECDKFALNEAA